MDREREKRKFERNRKRERQNQNFKKDNLRKVKREKKKKKKKKKKEIIKITTHLCQQDHLRQFVVLLVSAPKHTPLPVPQHRLLRRWGRQ